jgi:hypothetical protein
LAWTNEWKKGRNPLKVASGEFDAKRTCATVLFPHGLMANSPTQPIADSTAGKFGPFAAQLFVGEMNRARIVRVMLDKVAGEWQGACVPFYDGAGLGKGNHRLFLAKTAACGWAKHTSRGSAAKVCSESSGMEKRRWKSSR